MPPAARIGDYHTCPKRTGEKRHVGGPVATGAASVRMGGKVAARVGDKAVCRGPWDTIAQGSASVRVVGKQAARKGDRTVHGGRIVQGLGSVLVGDRGGSAPPPARPPAPRQCMADAAHAGALFVRP
ncbi:MAG: PAAR domain-containing protein [Maricaulaceae bacterium]